MGEDTVTKPAATANPRDHTVAHIDPKRQRIWDYVSESPLKNLWSFQGVPAKVVWSRTFKAFLIDNLAARAAELGYYFLFALFPTLVFASSLLGLVAAKASLVYVALLHYMALVVPASAFALVVETFNQTTRAASGGKIAFGLAAALWAASVGFGAIQDTANIVYKTAETRPYWRAKLEAIGVTVVLSLLISLMLSVLFGTDFFVRQMRLHTDHHYWRVATICAAKGASWIVVVGLLMLLFALIYYFAPDLKQKRWQWLSPGAAIGILGWTVASVALRVYLHYFDSYSATYGSLGAVIILLTWFYLTGLMLLTGAEINSEIQAAVAEKKLKDAGVVPLNTTAE